MFEKQKNNVWINYQAFKMVVAFIISGFTTYVAFGAWQFSGSYLFLALSVAGWIGMVSIIIAVFFYKYVFG
jgi:hypothetical protein